MLLAAEGDHLEVVQLLLEVGGNNRVDGCSFQWTPGSGEVVAGGWS